MFHPLFYFFERLNNFALINDAINGQALSQIKRKQLKQYYALTGILPWCIPNFSAVT